MGSLNWQGCILTSHKSLLFSLAFVRRAIITSLTGFLVIFWLLRDIGLRGIECVTQVYAKPVRCAGNLWFEIFFWLVVILLIAWDLWEDQQFQEYFNYWKKLWLVITFLFFTILSSTWSLQPQVTIMKSFILISASIAAVFIAFRSTPLKWMSLLAAYFFMLIVASYILILVLPSLGTMQNQPYNGAWSGVFWHRNYLGSIMAFASVLFLFRIFIFSGNKIKNGAINSSGFIASAFLVIGSRSAAGILTLVILCALFSLLLIWTKIQMKLKITHYFIIGVILIGGAILVLTNLDFIFGLLNRNTSLTGRIPLWNTLFDDYISNRLFFGHGYGAIWSFSDFRLGLQAELGWGYPVLIGDNGLVDILLHLGIIGAGIMVFIILFPLVKAVKSAFTHKSLLSLFPLITIVYIIVCNISLSLLIELEYLTWALLITSIMISIQHDVKIIPIPIENPD